MMDINYWEFLRNRDIVKIEKRKKIITAPKAFIAENIKECNRILDFGAGERTLLNYLQDTFFKGEYKSCDTDRSILHDYYSIDEIDGEYDAIAIIEVLEHIPFPEVIKTIDKLTKKLNPEGKIVITVPNVMCPGVQEQMDCTHVQHWPVRDLCAILLMFGFQNSFDLFRVYLEYFWGLKGYRAFLNKIIRRLIAMDYCQGVILIGSKNSN